MSTADFLGILPLAILAGSSLLVLFASAFTRKLLVSFVITLAALAAAIIRLLSDRDLRADLRARGRARARSFTWEKTAAATLAFYREVHARR